MPVDIRASRRSGALADPQALECLDVDGSLLAALRQSPIHHYSGHAFYTVLPSFRLGRLGLHIVDLQVAAFANNTANCMVRGNVPEEARLDRPKQERP